MHLPYTMLPDHTITVTGGMGSQLATATIILAGIACLVASLISFASIWLQLKNYRKPLLQRYVVRILIMVPLYATSSFTTIISSRTAAFLSAFREIYEAFTIYTFFELLINFLGGERAIIIMTYGRQPVQHSWPLRECLPKVDISDPYTFLAIKRGILQYTWLKPCLALATMILKATGTFQEGYLGLKSGYLWTGLIYNLSMTISLYSLALFWVCMHEDLKPFRPMPKFLGVKLIIFASYWQGFALATLQLLGGIPNNVAGYTPDNLAAVIQDTLLCFEMPAFAICHWHAFSWKDYAVSSAISARMPLGYAFRDAFGAVDLWQDTKQTFRGNAYSYHLFDPHETVMAHAESHSRVARVLAGQRYEQGGKGKYWVSRPGRVSDRTPLLEGGGRRSRMNSIDDVEPLEIDKADEALFARARQWEFGDYNYPVVSNDGSETPPLRDYQRLAGSPSASPFASPSGSSGPSSPVSTSRRYKHPAHARRHDTPRSSKPSSPVPSVTLSPPSQHTQPPPQISRSSTPRSPAIKRSSPISDSSRDSPSNNSPRSGLTGHASHEGPRVWR